MADKYTFKDVHRLYYWCNKVLPTVYDDSLSYYELLNKIALKLNTLIENYNELPEYIVQEIAEMLQSEELGAILQGVISNFMLNIKYPPAGITPAVGDGSTDDTEAIQGCIDWANENGGGAVYIPAGWYLTQSITLKENVSLIGYDRYATVFTLKGGATEPLVTAQGANTIADITLNANTAVQTEYQNALTVVGEDHLIRDVILDGGNYGLESTSTGHLQISNVIVPGCVIAGMYIHGSAQVQAENVMVENVSEIAGDASYIVNNNNGTYQIGTIARVDEGVVLNGNGNYIQLRVENATTKVTDNGTDNQYLIETEGDNVTNGQIEEVTTALETEVQNREDADDEIVTDLGAQITAEETARIAADSAINTALSEEVTNRTNADTAIQTQVDLNSENIENLSEHISNNEIDMVFTVTPALIGDTITRGQCSAMVVVGDTLYGLSTTDYDDYGHIQAWSLTSGTRLFKQRIRVGHGNSICYDYNENEFYIAPISTFAAGVSTETQNVYVYDQTFTTLNVITAPNVVHGVSFDSVTNKLYMMVSNHDGTIVVYEYANGIFTLVGNYDISVIWNNNTMLQDFAVRDGVMYIANNQGNITKIRISDAVTLGTFFVNSYDAGNVYDLGENEGMEFDPDGHLYCAWTFRLTYEYVDSDGANAPDMHGVFTEIPVGKYSRVSRNTSNIVHGTLTVDASKRTDLYHASSEMVSVEAIAARHERTCTILITNGTLESRQVEICDKNIAIKISSTASWTIGRIYLMGSVFLIQSEAGSTLNLPGGPTIDSIDRPAVIYIDLDGNVTGDGVANTSFVRWTSAKPLVSIGRLTNLPSQEIGICAYMRGENTLSIGSTAIN